jgi:PTS system N-acetylgalactosamine-specific IIA component
MIGIIITGHGRFSEGMMSSIEMIAGKAESLMGVNFLETESTDDLDKHLLEAYTELKQKNDGVIIVCDLLGGSPFKSAATLSVKQENVSVLAGINLASCLELIFARMNETDALKLADLMLEKDSNQLLKFTMPIRVERDGLEDGI